MKDKWIKQLQEAHNRLLHALDLVSDDNEISEGWTKKELIAHISGWYEEGVEGTPKLLQGKRPTSFRMTINGYNKRSVEKRKDMTLAEAQKEMRDLHKKWLNILEKLTEEEIKGFYGSMLGKKSINVLWMINMAIHHDEKHAKILEILSK